MMDSINETCYSFTDTDLLIVAICKMVTSMVSILGCLFVVLIMVTYKKYTFTFQRLVLYLTLSLLVDAVVRLIQGISYKVIVTNAKYCQALAFFYEYSAICILLSMLCMVMEIFLSLLQNRDTNRLKWIYAGVIFGISLCLSWIPLPIRRYGLAGSACSITYYNLDCNIDTIGLVTLVLLWWLPYCISFIVTGPVYLFILCRINKQTSEYTAIIEVQRNAVHDQETKHIGYFKWFPFFYFVINVLPIAREMCGLVFDKNYAVVWIITTLVLGLQGGVVTLVATLDPTTRRTLRWNSFKAAWQQNIMGRRQIEVYPFTKGTVTDSII